MLINSWRDMDLAALYFSRTCSRNDLIQALVNTKIVQGRKHHDMTNPLIFWAQFTPQHNFWPNFLPTYISQPARQIVARRKTPETNQKRAACLHYGWLPFFHLRFRLGLGSKQADLDRHLDLFTTETEPNPDLAITCRDTRQGTTNTTLLVFIGSRWESSIGIPHIWEVDGLFESLIAM